MVPAGKGLAAVFESALSVADQLADRLRVDVVFSILAGEAERCIAGFFVQPLELVQSKG